MRCESRAGTAPGRIPSVVDLGGFVVGDARADDAALVETPQLDRDGDGVARESRPISVVMSVIAFDGPAVSFDKKDAGQRANTQLSPGGWGPSRSSSPRTVAARD